MPSDIPTNQNQMKQHILRKSNAIGEVPGVITWKAFTMDNICKQVQLCSVSKMGTNGDPLIHYENKTKFFSMVLLPLSKLRSKVKMCIRRRQTS